MAYEEGSIQRGKKWASTPLRWLWNLIGFIIGAALVLFIIAIPLSMIWQDKPLLSYVYNEITDPILNTGAGNFLKKGLSTLTIPFSEKKQAEVLESYSWKSNIDENSKKQDLGVKITKFQATMSTVNAKNFQKVEAIAEGYASTTEPTEIEFLCLTEDNNIGEVANQNNILYLSPNRKEFFAVKCIYNKELFEIDESKTTVSKKIKIRATYDFTTEAYIPIYILQKDILDYKIQEGNKGPVRFEYNVFEDENINDKNLNKQDGTTSSVYTKGPVKLMLRSLYTQPYTEEGPFGSGSYYTLDIKIDDEIQWTGNIEEIEEFYLLIPEEISITTENFEYSTTEDNFQVYRAKDSLIEQLHKTCEPKNIIEKISNLIDEDCWRRGSIITSIEFSINNPPEEISQTFIRAELKYKFNDEKQDTITFLNTE